MESQRRNTLEEAGYVGYMLGQRGKAFLMDVQGVVERWQKDDDYAGYVIVIEGIGYKFVRVCDPAVEISAIALGVALWLAASSATE